MCIMEHLARGKERQLSCTAVAWCHYRGEDSSVLSWPSFSRGNPIDHGGRESRVTHFWTEGSSAPRQVPFTVLQGEGVEFLGRAADALIAISNYRLHIKFKDSVINVSFCHVLPRSSQNPYEVQGGIAPMLYLIMSPKSWGSLF